MSELTVGIDIGTTSVKALLVDEHGTVVNRARRTHELITSTPQTHEHDARAAWHDGVRAVWDQVRHVDGTTVPVAGVAVSAMVPSMAPVDAAGIPIGPGLLYGDERGLSEANETAGNQGEFEAFVRWARSHHPEAAGFWPAQAVANAALCGRGALDTSTAYTTYPLFDGRAWDELRCQAIGITVDQLPALVPGNAAVGRTPDGAAVGGGTIDAFAEGLVAGADNPGDVLVILGTTLIIWAATEGWPQVDGLWTIPHSTPGITMIGGASNAGGLFVQRVRDMTGDPDLRRIHPDHVPVWVPYLRGERTPWHDRDRRASLNDVDMTHDAASVLRAAYEACGFVVRHHLDLAEHASTRIVCSGGGTHVRPWLEALAEATGLSVDVVAVPEGAALGAAYLARVAAGLEPDTSGSSRWARVRERIEPRPEWAAAAAARYQRFRQLVA